jgi:hypothetical protein
MTEQFMDQLGARDQPVQKITTESGAVYLIDNGYWNKNGGAFERTIWAYCIDAPESDAWYEINQSEIEPLQVGKHLNIGGFNLWWLSTKIVSIELIPTTRPRS